MVSEVGWVTGLESGNELAEEVVSLDVLPEGVTGGGGLVPELLRANRVVEGLVVGNGALSIVRVRPEGHWNSGDNGEVDKVGGSVGIGTVDVGLVVNGLLEDASEPELVLIEVVEDGFSGTIEVVPLGALSGEGSELVADLGDDVSLSVGVRLLVEHSGLLNKSVVLGGDGLPVVEAGLLEDARSKGNDSVQDVAEVLSLMLGETVEHGGITLGMADVSDLLGSGEGTDLLDLGWNILHTDLSPVSLLGLLLSASRSTGSSGISGVSTNPHVISEVGELSEPIGVSNHLLSSESGLGL